METSENTLLDEENSNILLMLIRYILNSNIELEKKISNKIVNLNKNSLLSLIDNIKKEKLSLFIINGLKANKFNNDFYKLLHRQALIDNYICFMNFKYIKEISQQLNKYHLKYLFLKGHILSLQTTGKLNLRGPSNDIDILIEEKNVNLVVDILVENNFVLDKKSRVFINKNIIGAYSKFLEPELLMYKNFNSEKIYLDMHWRTSWIYDYNLEFDYLYNNRANIIYKNLKLSTLGIKDALTNSCNHCALNEWRNIREFIDIHYLVKICRNKKMKILSNKSDTIKKSINYAYQLTHSKYLKEYIDKDNFKKNKLFLYIKEYTKEDKNNYKYDYIELCKLKFQRTIKFLKLSRSLKSYFSIMLLFILPPQNLIDLNTGRIKKFRVVIYERFLLFFLVIKSFLKFHN